MPHETSWGITSIRLEHFIAHKGRKENIMAYTFTVTGVTYDNADGINRQELIKKLKGDPFVSFMPEPENPYDPKALAIVNRHGQILGYMSQKEPDRDGILKYMGICEFSLTACVKDPTKWNEKGKKKYSWGLDVDWEYRLQKDGDYSSVTTQKPKLPNTEQKQKRSRRDYRDTLRRMKRKHADRFSYQEIEKLRRAV